MKWALIIVVTTTGGLFSGGSSTQHELGPYHTLEACKQAAKQVPAELRWRRGNENFAISGKDASVHTFCIITEEKSQ